MLRRSSQIYVHLIFVVGMRIMDWGIGRFKGDVIESVYTRDGSGVLALTVHGQNGSILFAILGSVSMSRLFCPL
jgi:hypothetical protein